MHTKLSALARKISPPCAPKLPSAARCRRSFSVGAQRLADGTAGDEAQSRKAAKSA